MTANLFTRDDTFFGVCQGLGDDLGIPADLLRLAFVGALYLAPVPALAAYAAAGVLVFATHWLIPERARPAPAAVEAVEQAPVEVEAEPEALPLAA